MQNVQLPSSFIFETLIQKAVSANRLKYEVRQDTRSEQIDVCGRKVSETYYQLWVATGFAGVSSMVAEISETELFGVIMSHQSKGTDLKLVSGNVN